MADYPFTTLEPVLGTLQLADRQLVIADIPGLIEGASGGAGLGHEFLAHVERTRLLVHVLDLAPLDGSDPVANHATVERELAAHDPRLAALPRILALSKADLVAPEAAVAGGGRVAIAPGARGAGARSARAPPDRDSTCSAPSSAGASRSSHRRRCRDPEPRGTGRAPAVPSRAADAGPRRVPGAGQLPGQRRRRGAAGRPHDLDNEDALAHLERRLRGAGVIRALAAAGFQAGDEVEIAGVAFDLDPDV